MVRGGHVNVIHGAVHGASHHTHETAHNLEAKIRGPDRTSSFFAPAGSVASTETVPEQAPARPPTSAEYVRGYEELSLSVDTRKTVQTSKPGAIFALNKGTSRAILNQVKQKDRTVWAVIFLHPAFENSAICLIVLNAIWIGVDVDMNRPSSGIPKSFFEVGEIVFCVLFTGELLIRFLAYKHKEQFFKDPDMKNWNIFDTVLVSSMVLDTVVLTYVLQADGNQLRFMSTLRLLRLLRITRIFRMLPELGMMVKSLFAAVRSVGATCGLALGVMYIFAILVTQWTKSFGSAGKCIGDSGYEVCLQDYFGELRKSFLTLFQFLGFDDTFEILKPIFRENAVIGLLLVAYMLLVSFTILNMLIGIICDIVEESTDSEKKKLMHIKLEGMFTFLDTADKGSIRKKEFDNARTQSILKSVGLDANFAKNAFDILDSNRDGELQREEFIRMIFKCKNDPRSEDVLELEARIDKVVQAIGFGHDKTAVTDHERRIFGGGEDPGTLSAASREYITARKKDAKKRLSDRVSKEKWMLQRLKVLSTSLGNVLLLSEAGGLSRDTEVLMSGTGQAVGGQTWLQPFHMGARSNDALTQMVAPPFPSAGIMTIIRPAMRALHARLHALRAECKAFGMRYSGNVSGGQGQELIPRENLTPLDDLISEVLVRLDAAGRSLQLPGFTPALPRAAPRQRAVLEQRDDVAMLALEN
mmetsp:Transcript_66841/g.105736  ORF Transcript_66841/g.105736 Transcript_66841/m.105736 type:complete len:699 (+) Transcript_66841:89-2185(+)